MSKYHFILNVLQRCPCLYMIFCRLKTTSLFGADHTIIILMFFNENENKDVKIVQGLMLVGSFFSHAQVGVVQKSTCLRSISLAPRHIVLVTSSYQILTEIF